jgi:hypothetical protein
MSAARVARRVAFLDFDGVLAAFGRRDPMKLDPACCAILVEIVRRTGVELVVSSSAVYGIARDEVPERLQLLEGLLRDHGADLHLTDAIDAWVYDPESGRGHHDREVGIRRYVELHGLVDWIAIDDDRDAGRVDPTRLIVTERAFGLQPYHVAAALFVLDGGMRRIIEDASTCGNTTARGASCGHPSLVHGYDGCNLCGCTLYRPTLAGVHGALCPGPGSCHMPAEACARVLRPVAGADSPVTEREPS